MLVGLNKDDCLHCPSVCWQGMRTLGHWPENKLAFWWWDAEREEDSEVGLSVVLAMGAFSIRFSSISSSITTTSQYNFLYQSCQCSAFAFFNICHFEGKLVSALILFVCLFLTSHWNGNKAPSLGRPTMTLLGLPRGLWKLRPVQLDAAVPITLAITKQQIQGP